MDIFKYFLLRNYRINGYIALSYIQSYGNRNHNTIDKLARFDESRLILLEYMRFQRLKGMIIID